MNAGDANQTLTTRDVSPQDVEKVELVQFAQDHSLCNCCSWMARTTIIALAMRATGMSKPTVWRWWDRFLAEGVDGLLYDIPRRRGRKPISKDKASELIALAMPPPPEHASHWTLRALATKVGTAVSTV